jgi:DNA repair exonuclease SbcCD ATPase subunit
MNKKAKEEMSKKRGLEMKYKVGDLVVPADGSSYVGEITYISQEEDTVRHKCLKTGTEYEKSYYGFPVRYMSIVEMLEWSRELSKENADLHTKLILASGGDEAVRAALANSDACWRMEQEVIVRQLGEWRSRAEYAERELSAALDLPPSIGPAEGEAKRIVETLRRERDEARAELKKSEDDFQSVFNSRDEVIKERERARQACNAYWHDLMRIASLCEQTADEYPLKAVERTIKQFQEVIKQRDEARRDLGEILAIIHRDGGHYTGEHGISKSVADAHATWAAMVAERDALLVRVDCLRGALRKLLLSRDASWTGGHDWQESVDEAIKALGMEVDA